MIGTARFICWKSCNVICHLVRCCQTTSTQFLQSIRWSFLFFFFSSLSYAKIDSPCAWSLFVFIHYIECWFIRASIVFRLNNGCWAEIRRCALCSDPIHRLSSMSFQIKINLLSCSLPNRVEVHTDNNRTE